ncbi:VOC family protein [Nocardioides sp. JQ2195]|uniref:VOC family protein n=1 Tax=Nocardioides sp. JQ2195 TaxID=2592334 RepID=UPI00143EE420|nr:VOC family protein [Nocardioides sp. JQ2195]QIX25897.1 VOC family protein [Nocardioides sp. JQ2195]
MVDWQLTIDSNDPGVLVKFWAPALGYEVQPPPEGFDTWNDYYASIGVPEHELDANGDGSDRIHDPTGGGPPIWFQIVPERKTLKNRFHFDLFPTRRDRSLPVEERRRLVEATVEELLTAGASVIRRFPDDFSDAVREDSDGAAAVEGYFVLMADPEGNEFCVA